jgi:[glutamine synthetase] adenylyltransferase / [glutamine synthetase]-adenylyl-L-tyrosine phosphorylase
MALNSELIDRILHRTPRLDRGDVATFLERVEPEYLGAFEPAAIAGHLQALARLSHEHPVEVLLNHNRDGLVDCVVLAFDHPFEFSTITGIMAANGFDIERSDAFTLRKIKSAMRPANRRKPVIHRRDPMKDAVILDYFRGRLIGPAQDFEKWAGKFTNSIEEAIGLLEQSQQESIDRARRLVNERVTQSLARRKSSSRTMVSLEVQIEQLKQATRLRLRAPDTPAFLYALSTALSLHGLQINKTRARTAEGTAIDEIDVVDQAGAPLTDAQTIQQVQRSVLLTLQFCYFLDRAPDPFTALQRFDDLARQIVRIPQAGQWLELLANPLSMMDLAKLLGASNFIWEDFIRFDVDVLLPVLQRRVRGEEICPPARALPLRLERSLAGAKDFEDERKRLNEFKDRELFLIDLDHILAEENPDEAFRILSERLVFLAENLLAAASRRVYAELVRLYGRPRNEKNDETRFAIFGLGKLGGVALGYASDIELLFLFEDNGSTSGGSRGSLTNGEFFAILTRETTAYIQAKREGIFQVDLRLRPFGNGGPLASSESDFAAYYGPTGKAHAFEKLALVRLRWIAGNSLLGFKIEQLRDQLVYDGAPPDLAAIWEISAKMRQQHAAGGKYHAKHSDGALADLEQTVLLLQVLQAREAPQLRTPRLHEAMDGLRRAGIISAEEFERLLGAYQFLRRLINAQRMLRGSARDLFLPAEDSDELVHLARRMRYASETPGRSLLRNFKSNIASVQKFMRKKFRQ